MKFSCEKCGRSYVADEKVRGRAFKMKCKTCGNVILVKPGAPGTPGPLSLDPVAPPRIAAPPAAALAPGPLAPAAHDPFALSAADPFALPAGDPFAKPPADPFVTATRKEPPLDGAGLADAAPQELEPVVPRDDPFARAAQPGAAPAPLFVPPPPDGAAPDGVTTPGVPQLSEADAMFADLAEEMRAAHPPAAELTPAPAPPAAPAPHEPPAPAAPRAEAPPVARAAPAAPTPTAKSSRAGLVLAAAAALIVAVAAAAWVALTPGASGAPEHAAAAARPPPVPAAPERQAERAAPAPAAPARQEAIASPAAADSLPPAAPADLRADEAAEKGRRDDRPPAEPQRAAKPAAARPLAAAKARPAPAAQPASPPPPPEPPRPEVKVAQVQVQQRTRRAVEPAPPPDVHTAPAAPPLTSNANLPPLDDAMIEATVAKYARSFDGCAVAARQNEPQLALDGRKVVVTMTVNPNGKALYPTLDDVELSNSEFGKCVKRESARMIFPEFGGEPIRARVPLTLK